MVRVIGIQHIEAWLLYNPGSGTLAISSPISPAEVEKNNRLSLGSSSSSVVCARCELHQGAAVSTFERNTLLFLERWRVRGEVSYADVLYEQTEI